ncbi:Serine/threonine-protein kinase smu1 [Phlyctochytrium planicorne]|nr:Serine/threonine-protein kinase smu1 [Phlyctochytrium planicorne]
MEIEASDVIRLVLQFCKENNLHRTFETLQDESNVHLNAVDSLDIFVSNVNDGKWDHVLRAISHVTIPTKKLVDLYEHIVIELVEMKEIGAARSLLRQTDTMQHLRDTNPERYLKLEEVLSRPHFDAKLVYNGSREKRRSEIASALASDVMIANPSRLLALLSQSLKYQQSQGLLPTDFAYDLFRGTAIMAKSEDDCPPSQCFKTIKFPRKAKAESAAFSPDGQFFVTGTLDGMIEVWNYFTGKHRNDLKYQKEESFMMMETAVLCLAYGRDNDILASGAQDGNIKVWRVSTGQCIKRFISAHSQGITALKFSKDNTQILSGSFDFTARLHGIKSGKMLKEFRGHISYVNDVHFSTDGQKIWDAKNANCLGTLTLHDGKIATGGVQSASVIKIISFPSSDDYLICNKSPFLYLMSANGQIIRTFTAISLPKKGETSPDFLAAGISAKGKFVYGIASNNNIYCFVANAGSVTNSFPVSDSEVINFVQHPFSNISAVLSNNGISGSLQAGFRTVPQMGNCGSAEEKEAAERNREIEAALKAESKASVKSVKLLLLGIPYPNVEGITLTRKPPGPGDSGKSTLLKQFRLIHGHGFTEQERTTFRSVIMGNLLGSMKTLIMAMDMLQISYGVSADDPKSDSTEQGADQNGCAPGETTENTTPATTSTPSNEVRVAAALIKNCPINYGEDDHITKDVQDAIHLLWKEPGIQRAYSRRNEYQLYSACQYYMSNIDRICDPNFSPTDQDILSARVITTSITETQIKVESMTFRIFDVGGQRSERKKWAPYFDDVKCIIFIADISAYDLTLVEENSVNRMTESLNLFKTICNHPLFKNTAMILFLNKIDLFQEKLQTVALKDFFPDFKGANTFEEASEFFAERFSSLNQNDTKIIYVHFTWATDTTQIKKVLLTTNQIILQLNLQAAGIF